MKPQAWRETRVRRPPDLPVIPAGDECTSGPECVGFGEDVEDQSISCANGFCRDFAMTYDGRCESDVDCRFNAACVRYDESVGCSTPMDHHCDVDEDCAAGFQCTPHFQPCGPQRICTLVCNVDDDCPGQQQFCRDRRCTLRSCTEEPGLCEAYETCLGLEVCLSEQRNGFGCAATVCETTEDCGGGFCLRGRCAGDGVCYTGI